MLTCPFSGCIVSGLSHGTSYCFLECPNVGLQLVWADCWCEESCSLLLYMSISINIDKRQHYIPIHLKEDLKAATIIWSKRT